MVDDIMDLCRTGQSQIAWESNMMRMTNSDTVGWLYAIKKIRAKRINNEEERWEDCPS
jgi:hypothetical protein